MKGKELKIYTFDEVKEWFSNHRDPKRYEGWELKNDILSRVSLVYDGYFCRYANPSFEFESGFWQGPFSGVNMDHAIGRALRELIWLLRPDMPLGGKDALGVLANVPLRIVQGKIRLGQFCDCDGYLTFFGHLFQDRFIRLRELVDIDLDTKEAK